MRLARGDSRHIFTRRTRTRGIRRIAGRAVERAGTIPDTSHAAAPRFVYASAGSPITDNSIFCAGSGRLRFALLPRCGFLAWLLPPLGRTGKRRVRAYRHLSRRGTNVCGGDRLRYGVGGRRPCGAWLVEASPKRPGELQTALDSSPLRPLGYAPSVRGTSLA